MASALKTSTPIKFLEFFRDYMVAVNTRVQVLALLFAGRLLTGMTVKFLQKANQDKVRSLLYRYLTNRKLEIIMSNGAKKIIILID